MAAHATRKGERSFLLFTALLVMSTLLFQRFSVSFGTSSLSIVGPIGFLLAGHALLKQRLVFHATRLAVFLVLVALVMLGGVARAAIPADWGTPPSWLSASQFLAFTSFGVLAFAQPVDEARFFRVVNAAFAAIAAAGMLQFALQFAGLGLFSFDGLIPESLIFQGFNTAIPIGVGGYFKSNGFFLIEPSVFSQVMALAVIIELLIFRRLAYLAAFVVGLMVSISGTGWVMILGFVLTASFSLGRRGLQLAAATVGLGVVAVAGLAVAFPDGFELFMARTSELNGMGSSGHDRFVTPWWLVQYVLDRTPWAALYGVGPGVTDHMAMHPPWMYNTNPPVKIGLEYGLPSFVAYLLYILAGRRTRTQKALLAPALVLLLLDGGNSQFPPVLFLVLLLICTARLTPAAITPSAAAAARRSLQANGLVFPA